MQGRKRSYNERAYKREERKLKTEVKIETKGRGRNRRNERYVGRKEKGSRQKIGMMARSKRG